MPMYKSKYFASFAALAFASTASCLTVTPSNDPTALANALLGGTSGITLVSATYNGAAEGSGLYTEGPQGIPNSIVLTTGDAVDVIPSGSDSGDISKDMGTPGSSLCQSLNGGAATFDAAVLTMNVILGPGFTGFTSQYVFATEEYPTWVGSGFNDVFGIFIDGQQIAMDSTGAPITINGPYFKSGEVLTPPASGSSMHGSTPVLTSSYAAAPGAHKIDIAICDTADALLDSAVFVTLSALAGSSNSSSSSSSSSAAPSSSSSVSSSSTVSSSSSVITSSSSGIISSSSSSSRIIISSSSSSVYNPSSSSSIILSSSYVSTGAAPTSSSSSSIIPGSSYVSSTRAAPTSSCVSTGAAPTSSSSSSSSSSIISSSSYVSLTRVAPTSRYVSSSPSVISSASSYSITVAPTSSVEPPCVTYTSYIVKAITMCDSSCYPTTTLVPTVITSTLQLTVYTPCSTVTISKCTGSPGSPCNTYTTTVTYSPVTTYPPIPTFTAPVGPASTPSGPVLVSSKSSPNGPAPTYTALAPTYTAPVGPASSPNGPVTTYTTLALTYTVPAGHASAPSGPVPVGPASSPNGPVPTYTALAPTYTAPVPTYTAPASIPYGNGTHPTSSLSAGPNTNGTSSVTHPTTVLAVATSVHATSSPVIKPSSSPAAPSAFTGAASHAAGMTSAVVIGFVVAIFAIAL